MPSLRRLAGSAALLAALAGCSAGRHAGPALGQQVLDAWIGVPVQAFGTHPLFSAMPLFLSRQGKVEVRNGSNSEMSQQCFAQEGHRLGDGKQASPEVFSNCSTNWITSNNLFCIENGKVIRCAPTGNCFTDERVWPQPPYRRS